MREIGDSEVARRGIATRRHFVARATILALVLGSATVLACANVAAPTGGPEDFAPPVVVSITPGSGQTDIRPREVVVQFNEVISEMPRGAQDLGSLVFISPKSGVPRVDWGRNRITIRPRDGFRVNTVYTVEIRPGITDLRTNVLDSAIRIVFTTGGEIPETRVSGAVFDWVAGRPAALALVEAIAPDSTRYQTLADSVGRYSLHHLPATRYVLRAVIDRNNNRDLERLEPWDTVGVMVTADATADLYAFQHDTLPMRVQTVTYDDSLAELRVTFDKPFAPEFVLDPAMFTLVGPDSTPIAITRVITGPERRVADSVRRVERADSVAQAQRDTTAAGRARADSLERQRIADSVTAAARQAEQMRRDAIRRGGRPAPVVDSTPPPKMNRPQPFADIILVPAQPLSETTSYRLSATGLRSISGTTTPTPARTFAVPRRPPPPPPPRDTSGTR